jgi:beta-N-acetylhexosaminidase
MNVRRDHVWRSVCAAPAVALVALALAVATGCGSGGADAPPAAASGAGVLATTVASVSPATAVSSAPAASQGPAVPSGLAGWSNRRLAAQLAWCSVPATDPLAGRRFARMGVGGIVILGAGARSGIGGDLAAVLRAAPNGIRPFIASDEEGGLVQRLRDVIYPLPSARAQGAWSTPETGAAAEAYGRRMRKLNVAVDFAPVADLDVPGKFISGQDRAFSRDPDVVAAHVVAWVKGLRDARVLATVKHWPGHGWASDTHTGAARVPSLSVLRRYDMVPFEKAFAAGVPLVMVGHLRSKGLTGDQTPASLSKTALAYLRGRTGEKTVIVTDSLSMAATTKALGIKLPAAAVRALKAGADLALFATGDPGPVIDAVTAAIKSGRLPRADAEAKVLRVLELKRRAGLAPVYQP